MTPRDRKGVTPGPLMPPLTLHPGIEHPDLPIAGTPLCDLFDGPHYDPWADWSKQRKGTVDA